jgi:PAS domain S-box-containing protein
MTDATPTRDDLPPPAGPDEYRKLADEVAELRAANEALRASEERYRALFERSLTPVYLHDLEGRFIDANAAAVNMMGYSKEDIGKVTMAELMSADQLPLAFKAIQEVVETGAQREPTEFRLRHKDGREVHVVTQGAAVLCGGAVVAVQSIAKDMTQIRRVEAELRRGKALLDAQVEASIDGILVVDPQGKKILQNQRTIDLWKLPPEVAHDPDDDRQVQYVRQLTKDPKGFLESVRYLYDHPDETSRGETELVDGTVLDRYSAPVRGHDGQLYGRIWTFRDITERKRAEVALQASERNLAEAQRLTHIGSFEYDFATDRVQWSEEMFRIFGITKEDFGGRQADFHRRVHPADLPAVEAVGRRGLVPGAGMLQTDLRVLRPDGTERTVRMMFETSIDVDGRPLRRFGTMLDITEARQAKEESARLEAQLRQAQKMESVGRLAGGVAHDFNNMLSVILTNVEFALEQVDRSGPLHADLEEIRKAASRSAELTRQLLGFARKQTIAPEVLDLNGTVENTIAMLGRLIGEDLDLAWHPGADLWPVRVDPSQVDQILTNLCVNARDAIGGVGRVTIQTSNRTLDAAYCATQAGVVPGDYVQLAVSDDGCGMDRDTQTHLFEPFFTTKAAGQGTGLGLATVYGIVTQNGGFIDVQTAPDRGSTFTVYLPRHTPKGARKRTSNRAAEPSQRGHETILLVEDEPALLKGVGRMLAIQGYAVVAASTPGEAMRLAREHPGEIDLLVTDVVLPEMDGRQLARNVLALYPQVKRLFMSGCSADVVAHRGVLEEGVAFIQKPFLVRDLAAKVREVLDGGPDD